MEKQKNRKKTRVLLAGGHAATTAMATVQEIVRRGKKKYWDLYWVGSRKAMEGTADSTLEFSILPGMGVKCFSIISGRFQRKFTIWTIPSLAKIPLSFVHAFFVIKEIKPDVILSFGGHAALPVVVVGKFFKIPILLHEQTMAVGRTNKASARFANKIALARKSSLKFLPKEKCVVVGNPVMTQILQVGIKEKIGKPPTIYITGGSRGATAINAFVEIILKRLLKDFSIIHQVGSIDFIKFQKIKRSLSSDLRRRYELHSKIDPMKIDKVFRQADIVISRAGANTVSEIIACKRPAILIPLPIAYLDEQKKNAQFAQKYGIATVLDQKNLTSEKLLKEIINTKNNWSEIVARVKNKRSPDRQASLILVNLIEEVIS